MYTKKMKNFIEHSRDVFKKFSSIPQTARIFPINAIQGLIL
jgi:hypothetical protein